jgi:glycosyltransferase involved in cell wall biosynthesis
MRVFLSSQFDTFSGYGNDAVDIALGLSRAGVDVVPWATKVLPGLPREFTDLLVKDPTGEYDVVLCFAPPFDIQPDELVRFAPRAVGWSMWETSAIETSDMLKHGFGDRNEHTVYEEPASEGETFEEDYIDRWWTWSKHRARDHRGLDLMLVTCPMNVDAFHAADKAVNIEVLPCGVDVDKYPLVERPTDRRFRFGMIGMLAGRKDPMLLVQAWKELKDEHPDFDAILELKTSCPGLHPKMVEVYPDLVIHDRAWPTQQVIDWYSTIDCLISVSRGEGNNKPAMEFMSTGGPVIASNWSGHQNWLYPESGWPLPGKLMPTHPNRPDVLDFRVDIEALKAAMLDAYRNRDVTAAKGAASARIIRSSLSWEAVIDKLVRHLGSVL